MEGLWWIGYLAVEELSDCMEVLKESGVLIDLAMLGNLSEGS